MKLTLHLPRASEATIKPAVASDINIEPVFYKKKGWVNTLFLTTQDAKGRSTQYVLSVNAGNKDLKLEKLVAVVPDCDTDEPTKDEENEHNSGSPTDAAVKDKDVR